MFTYDAKELRQTIEDTLGPLAGEGVPPYEMTFKFMFGGIMAYTSARPFASLSLAGIGLSYLRWIKKPCWRLGVMGFDINQKTHPVNPTRLFQRILLRLAALTLRLGS